MAVEVSKVEADLLEFVRRDIFAAQVDANLDTDLIQAGFDSMSLVRVLVFLEQTYGTWIPESEITGDSLQNLRTLAATVCRVLNASK